MTGQEPQVAGAGRPCSRDVIELPFAAHDRAHASGDERCADDHEDDRHQRKHFACGQHERQHGTEREYDVNRGQDEHEL